MVTIKDVAQHAGVSVASVSRYINNRGYVRVQTGEKIAIAIKELNYVPNEIARSLSQKKSKLIGVLLPDITNPYFPLIAKGIEETLIKNGYMMLLANTADSTKQLNQYMTTFAQNNVSGIITALPIEPLENMIVVGVDRVYDSHINTVLPDDYLGGRLIGEKLLTTTFNNILIITGDLSFESAKNRLNGLLDVIDKETSSYEIYESLSFNVSDIDTISSVFFEKYKHVDTLVASNDYLALKMMQKAQQLGLSIPKDLQIIGYDGIPFTEMTYPKLTTIKQPAYELGKKTAEVMIEALSGSTAEIKEYILPVELQNGESLR
ncbi:LacI family DNA-binding transcriptional regulator [Vagococcus jeotgali]|uniref:LacI family DNA-binding transcriptional regulator n=1 Tax=Vagococcus jeotgali TaxID=3109030 RepID=UPI002DDC7C84|nr:LacI family DNA-binding transcriptional regulator [Vagococcus sp. B2T-5]